MKVKIDIGRIVREILEEGGVVFLKGIGTLKLRHLPSQFILKGSAMAPPSVTLEIADESHSNESLRSRLMSGYDLKKSKAEKVILQFNQKLLNGLINYDKVYIQDVGVIINGKDGQFEIIPDQDLVDQFYSGLPEIPVHFIPLSDKSRDGVVSATGLDETTTEIPVGKQEPEMIVDEGQDTADEFEIKGNDDPGGSAPLSIEQKEEQLLQNDPIPDPLESGKDENDDPPIVVPLVSGAESKAVEERDGQQPDTTGKAEIHDVEDAEFDAEKSVIQEPPASEKHRRKIIWPYFLALAGLLLIVFVAIKMCSAEEKATTAEGAVVSSDSSALVDTEDGVADDSKVSPAIDQVSSEPVWKECIIIAGSFTKRLNVERMRESIEGAGYNLYLEAYGPYTRVGARLDYQEGTLDSVVREFRTLFGEGAWLLEPRMHIPH